MPVKIWGLDVVGTGKAVFKDVGKHDLSGFAAQLAYRFFLALFPFFIFLAALGGFIAGAFNVEDPTGKVMNLIGESLPDDASSVVRGQLESLTQNRNAGLLSLGIIGAIWAAAGGMGALIKGFNRIYLVEESRPIYLRYALSIGLTILGAGSILIAFLLLIIGQTYGLKLADEAGLAETAGRLVNLARWPLVALFILTGSAVIYWAGPNVQLPFRFITIGSVFFTASWLIATFAFGIYVSNFGNYSATYGSLGAVVILLFWFYLTGLLVLLGAEINAYLSRVKAPEQMEAQGADVPGYEPRSARRQGEKEPVQEQGPRRPNEQREPKRTARPATTKPLQLGLVTLISSVALWRATQSLIAREK